MKLYYTPSACSFAVRIALNEAGANYHSEAVDLKTKKTASGQSLTDITSKSQVPALQLDNGYVLTEAPAILQYIADTHPDKHLLAKPENIERYNTLGWLTFIGTELHRNFSLFFRNFDEDTKQKAGEALAEKFAYVNTILSQQNYLSGDTFTIADAHLFTICRWMKVVPTLPHFPSIEAYKARLLERPAIQKALKEEGLTA